jgi:CheY-like chemotaxis protein
MIRQILLLDDDEDDQLIFKNALDGITGDINLIFAGNGLRGLEYLRSIPALQPLPELIFMDLNMPLMNGFEFLAIIKRDPKFQHIPVVIFSTSDNPSDKQKACSHGAVKFLTKSPEFSVLKNELIKIYNSLIKSKMSAQ